MTPIQRRAFRFASEAHAGQRYGDEPYMAHPCAVRQVLFDFGFLGGDLPVAALLHDTIEDTSTTWDDIRAIFGERVADLVEAVTGRGETRAERVASAHDKIIAFGRDAARLKIADRIANVEASAGIPRYLTMYREEQAGFEDMLARAGLNEPAMLARLRRAIGSSAAAPVDAVRAIVGPDVEVLDFKTATEEEREAFFERKHGATGPKARNES